MYNLVNRLCIKIYVAEVNVKIVLYAAVMQGTIAKTYINRFKFPFFYCFRRETNHKNKYDLILMPLHFETSYSYTACL